MYYDEIACVKLKIIPKNNKNAFNFFKNSDTIPNIRFLIFHFYRFEYSKFKTCCAQSSNQLHSTQSKTVTC